MLSTTVSCRVRTFLRTKQVRRRSPVHILIVARKQPHGECGYTVSMAGPRIILWAIPGQEALLKDVVSLAKLDVVGVGSNTPDAASMLARALNTQRVADWHSIVQDGQPDMLWLAGPDPLGIEQLRWLSQTGMTIISSHPQVCTLSDVSDENASFDWPHFVPRMRSSPGFRAAADVLPQFGQAQCVNVFFRAGPKQGTLFASM